MDSVRDGKQAVNLLGLDREGLRRFFTDLGEKPFRADQLMKWVYRQGLDGFAGMTDLGEGLRSRLQQSAVIQAPRMIKDEVAADGTRKWLLQLDGANAVESVFIPEDDRGTLCISSQVGCALRCPFCATGMEGFNRNLGVAEIIGQLWLATRILNNRPAANPVITNVVMMGMGEPLLNLENVVPAMRLMMDDYGYGLSKRRITLSTAGLVPLIDRLRESCQVSLAVSLHAPNDALRDVLVPLNRKYPIGELLAACRRYVAGAPRHKVTFEYVMLDGVNDDPRHARELVRLLASVPAKINLIPFNGFAGSRYRRSGPATIDRFREVLLRAGLMTVTRRPRGEDIGAACGQLAGRVQDRSRRSVHRRPLAVGAP